MQNPNAVEPDDDRLTATLDLISEVATQEHIDPSVAQAVFRTENRGNIALDPNLTSPKGARGLMQLTPGAITDIGGDPKKFVYDDAVENVKAGVRYLRVIQDRYGITDPIHQMVAYNMGPGALLEFVKSGQPFDKINAETKEYVTYASAKFQDKKFADADAAAAEALAQQEAQGAVPTPAPTPKGTGSVFGQLNDFGPRQVTSLGEMATGQKPFDALEAGASVADLAALAAIPFGGLTATGIKAVGARAFSAALQGGATVLDSLRTHRQANSTKTLGEAAASMTTSDWFLVGLNTLSGGIFGAQTPMKPPPVGIVGEIAAKDATRVAVQDISDVASSASGLEARVAGARWSKEEAKHEGRAIVQQMRTMWPSVEEGQAGNFFKKIPRDDTVSVTNINKLMTENEKSYQYSPAKGRGLGKETKRAEVVAGGPGQPDKIVEIGTGEWTASSGELIDLYRDVGAEINQLQGNQLRTYAETVRLKDLKTLRSDLKVEIKDALPTSSTELWNQARVDVKRYYQDLRRGEAVAVNFHPGVGAVNPAGLLADLSPTAQRSEKALERMYGKTELSIMRETTSALVDLMEEGTFRRRLGVSAYTKAIQQTGAPGRGSEAIRKVYQKDLAKEMAKYEAAMKNPKGPGAAAVGSLIMALYGAGGYAALGMLKLSPGGRAATAIGTAAFLQFAQRPMVAGLLRKLKAVNPASRQGLVITGRLVSMAHAEWGDQADSMTRPRPSPVPSPQTTPMGPPPVRVPIPPAQGE